MEAEFRTEIRKELLKAFTNAEQKKKPALRELFTDVYDELTPALREQEQELRELIRRYPEYYPTDDHAD
jgi:2-oxoisovalerate dehydrogenase E1 component alpha subunit